MAQQIQSLRSIHTSRQFWRFAPQGGLILGGQMAIQGLWVVPWLMEVNGVNRSTAAEILFTLELAMLAGFAFVATCATWLARRGVSPMALLTGGMGLARGVEWCIVMDLAPPTELWPLLGRSFSLGNLAYSPLTATFPVHLSARVNTALNLMVFVGAFGLQWGFGTAVEAFAASGLSRADAFRVTLGSLLAAQVLAFAWFLIPVRHRSARALAA